MGRIFRTVRGFEQIRLLEESLSPSLEDYLEMIFRKTNSEEDLRLGDLADLLHVSAASATKNVQRLANLGFVSYEPYGKIKLTDLGKKTGEVLLARHETIERFFRVLGVGEIGFEETEMIEHYLSEATVKKLNILTAFLEKQNDEWQEFSENQ